MSNLGLELALKARGIPFERSKVGDRYVMELLKEKGWKIGGENSGHILDLDHGTTGDGIVAGILVLAAMRRQGVAFENMTQGLTMFPQILVNVRFEGQNDFKLHPHVIAVKEQVEQEMAESGRYCCANQALNHCCE